MLKFLRYLYFQEWSRGAVRARDGKSTKKKKKKKYRDEIMTESEVCGHIKKLKLVFPYIIM